MNIEQSFFIRCLNDFINEKSTEICEDIKWDNIVEYAKKQQVESIIYFQCKHRSEIDELRSKYNFDIFSSVNRSNNLESIKSEFEKANLPYLIVKGFKLAQLYPLSSFRTMGDTDILVKEDDLKRVENILLSLGYTKYFASLHEFSYKNDWMLVEIHTSLIHDGPGKEKLIPFFHRAWDFYSEKELDWNFHFLFLIAHLRGHLTKEGAGLRQFIDIAVVEKNVKLDWNWISDKAKEIELFDFMTVVLSFVEKWFGIKSQFSVAVDENFFQRATQEIIENGVFGFDNGNKTTKMISGNSTIRGKKIGIIRFRYIIDNTFPKIHYMRQLPYCNYLVRFPFLLPVSWIHRFLYRIFNKNSRKIYTDKFRFNKTEILDRIEFLNQWKI